MESIKELFKIGVGPSSSHTMGPQRICESIQKEVGEQATRYEVTLYGSLALTGKGHLTDYIIEKTLAPCPVSISWQIKALPAHPNGMMIVAYDKDDHELKRSVAYSIGGGSIVFENESFAKPRQYYPHQSIEAIENYLDDVGMDVYTYILQNEDDDFEDYLREVLKVMEESVERGLTTRGYLPGKLHLKRVAADLYEEAKKAKNERLLLTSFAYAVSEGNASGEKIVTAPTCGASGVLPALIYYCHRVQKMPESKILRALGIAGLFGNLIKTNATISGAEGGCQAEVGSAISMTAAAYASLLGLKLHQIEYAAEMGLEHQLGLTCDPVGGYVQIPCIERNGFGVLRAMDAAIYARELGKLRENRVSFDSVVRVMKNTGHDLNPAYRETSLGGLAKELVIDD